MTIAIQFFKLPVFILFSLPTLVDLKAGEFVQFFSRNCVYQIGNCVIDSFLSSISKCLSTNTLFRCTLLVSTSPKIWNFRSDFKTYRFHTNYITFFLFFSLTIANFTGSFPFHLIYEIWKKCCTCPKGQENNFHGISTRRKSIKRQEVNNNNQQPKINERTLQNCSCSQNFSTLNWRNFPSSVSKNDTSNHFSNFCRLKKENLYFFWKKFFFSCIYFLFLDLHFNTNSVFFFCSFWLKIRYLSHEKLAQRSKNYSNFVVQFLFLFLMQLFTKNTFTFTWVHCN